MSQITNDESDMSAIALLTSVVAYRDPLAIIGQYEASPPGSYTSLVGGGQITSNTQYDQYGFPIWAGWKNSHAAGRYQFEPATWKLYAARLGISDFSPRSQDAVAVAAYAAHGFQDWAPYDARLAAAIQAAGGMSAFSLGASWLAGRAPTVTPETVTLAVTDQSGRKGVGVITLQCCVIALVLAAAIALYSYPLSEPPTKTQAAGFDWRGSTFYFDSNLHPVRVK